MAAQMLTVCVEGNDEPLGFIEITSTSTLSDARESILSELEGLPEHFRFIVPSPTGIHYKPKEKDLTIIGAMVKLSLVQEAKRAANSFMPQITLREVPPEGPQATIKHPVVIESPPAAVPPATTAQPAATNAAPVETARPTTPTPSLVDSAQKDLHTLDLNAHSDSHPVVRC